MILKRFYDQKLAQASYLIGCGQTGEAIVFDPNRDTDQYLAAARAEGLRVSHVTETHIHADFVSGSRELADRAGARLFLSGEGGKNWQYAFASEDKAVLIMDGSGFNVGNVRIDTMHTPGHTPEHVAFMVTDTAAATAPIGIVTGDFVFVGDVGRPDLLEKAARVAGTMEDSARTLFRSLQRFKTQPDYLQIWPGHGAGSACGKGLSAIPHSTVGYERLFNWAFSIDDEDEFTRLVLAGQPEPPRYFADMKRINREGPRVLHGFVRPPETPSAKLQQLLKSDAQIIDTRPAAAHAEGHVPGTLSIPLNKSFTSWAGWLLSYDRDIYLLLDDKAGEKALDEAIRDLAMIGFDRVTGVFPSGVIEHWTREGGRLETTTQVSTDELSKGLGEVTVVDVRALSEWEAGHIPGALHIPLGHLADRIREIPADRPVVMQCQGGGRSAIAASVAQKLGRKDVSNLTGGYGAWDAAGNKTQR